MTVRLQHELDDLLGNLGRRAHQEPLSFLHVYAFS